MDNNIDKISQMNLDCLVIHLLAKMYTYHAQGLSATFLPKNFQKALTFGSLFKRDTTYGFLTIIILILY